jgi:hypothetical protein
LNDWNIEEQPRLDARERLLRAASDALRADQQEHPPMESIIYDPAEAFDPVEDELVSACWQYAKLADRRSDDGRTRV